MPNPWKKAKFSRFVSNLRSKRGDPLVVQTGFPTFLADLIVKNQSRMRRPSSRKKPPSPELQLTGFRVSQIVVAAAAAVRSPSDGCSPRSDSASCEELDVLPVVGIPRCDEIIEEIHSPMGIVEETQSTLESPEKTQAPIFEVPDAGRSRDESQETWRSRGFGILVMVVFMMILAFGPKKLAFVITALAFALLFIESAGKYMPSFMKPCTDGKRRLKSVIGGVSVLLPPDGFDSNGTGKDPIEADVIPEFDLALMGLHRCSEISVWDQKSEGSKESENQVETQTSIRKQKAGTGNFMSNKLLRKLVPKKFRGPKAGKEGKVLGLDLANKKEAAEGDEEVEDDDDGDNDVEDDVPSLKTSYEALDADIEDAGFVKDNVDRTRRGNVMHLAFFAIVLIGLVGGRIAAVVLTVVWYLLVKSTGSTWIRLKGH